MAGEETGLTIEPAGRDYLSQDHWIGDLSGHSKQFLEAAGAYKGDPSLPNLAASLKGFAEMGDILYLRRPAEVAESKFGEVAGQYNAAAEVFINFLLPEPADQRQLQLEAEYSDNDWTKQLQEHFAAAVELDGKLAAETTEQDRGRLASLATARLIRLGQMIFFKMPAKFEPQTREFQQFFRQAMTRYLDRLEGLLTPTAGVLEEEAIAAGEAEETDYSQVELPPKAEEWWRKVDKEGSKDFLLEGKVDRFLAELKGLSPGLDSRQKETLLYRFFQPDGWMWRRLKTAVENNKDKEESLKTFLNTIEFPALFESMAIDHPISNGLIQMMAAYSCGPGGILDSQMRGILDFYHFDIHFPPAGIANFGELAYQEYQKTLEAEMNGTESAKVIGNLYYTFSLLEKFPVEYLEPLRRGLRQQTPRIVSIALEQMPYYEAWEVIKDLGNKKDFFGELDQGQFDQVFVAMLSRKFGFRQLARSEAMGEKRGFLDPLDAITRQGDYLRGAFDPESFGKYLADSHLVQFFEAVADEPVLWPDGEEIQPDVFRAIINMNFYDQAQFEKMWASSEHRFSGEQKVLLQLMRTKQSLKREVARRRALVERELMINLAMTGELPVHNEAVDGLVGSAEAREIVQRVRKMAQETISLWWLEGRREEIEADELIRIRERLFFGRDKLVEIFGREFSGWFERQDLKVAHDSSWAESAADRFLAAGTTGKSREELMTQINSVRKNNLGDFGKLTISGELTEGEGKLESKFIFSEPPLDQQRDYRRRVSIKPNPESDLMAELRQIAEKTKEAPPGSLLSQIHDRLAEFTSSRLANQLDRALRDEIGDDFSRSSKILGILRNSEIQPVRQAVKDLAMLKLFGDVDGEFGAGEIELTDGRLGFKNIYPPLLIGGEIAEISPYSVTDEAALTIVVGPNGSGKTMLISAMAVAEAMALTGIPPLAEAVRIPRDAEGVPLMMIGAATTTQVSRFDNSVREAKAIDQRLAVASSVTMDEAFAGTGDIYRGHLQTAMALKALTQGRSDRSARSVRLTTHQTETLYGDLSILGIVDDLSGLGLAGETRFLSVDAYHQVVPGRISSFGIEMAAGAGLPTVIAENAKKLRDGFTIGTPVILESVKPHLMEEKPMAEWSSKETLARLGIDGMWNLGDLGYGDLSKGKGDVLGFLFKQFDIDIDYKRKFWHELWFKQTMARLIQRQESGEEWRARTAALKRYAEDGEQTGLEKISCERLGSLLANFMIVDTDRSRRDKKLEAEKMAYEGYGHDKSIWKKEKEDRDLEHLGWGIVPITIRDIRLGKLELGQEMGQMGEYFKEIERISGVDSKADWQTLAEALTEVRQEHRRQATAVLAKAVSNQAIAAMGGFYGNVADKPGYDNLRQVLIAAGWKGKGEYRLTGNDLTYFLKDKWRSGDYSFPMQVLRSFGEEKLVERKEMDWHNLFDGSWEAELNRFPVIKSKNLVAGEIVAELGRGEWGQLMELFTWMEEKKLTTEMMETYKKNYPLTMTMFGVYKKAMDVDFIQRWQDKLWGDCREQREQAIEALELANVNMVLAAGLRQTEKTHLVFTEVGEGEEVELEEGYNPGALQAGIKEVPQTVNWSSGKAMIISGPNTGGKTSLAKKIMVAAALHKAMGVGTGRRVRLPSPDRIGGIYASINAAETRKGEGNLASEARDVGNFLGDYLANGCPSGVWFFGDELFSGTGQADQAGLWGAVVDAVTASGGKCIVTTNESGVIASLDQGGILHTDVKFSYGDPTTQFIPMSGVGGAESFQVARDLGLDPRLVDLAESLAKAQEELKLIRQKQAKMV